MVTDRDRATDLERLDRNRGKVGGGGLVGKQQPLGVNCSGPQNLYLV